MLKKSWRIIRIIQIYDMEALATMQSQFSQRNSYKWEYYATYEAKTTSLPEGDIDLPSPPAPPVSFVVLKGYNLGFLHRSNRLINPDTHIQVKGWRIECRCGIAGRYWRAHGY